MVNYHLPPIIDTWQTAQVKLLANLKSCSEKAV